MPSETGNQEHENNGEPVEGVFQQTNVYDAIHVSPL